MKTVALLLFAFASLSFAAVSYNGFKVYRIVPSTSDQVEILQKLGENENYDVWKESRALNSPTDIMIPPNHQEGFQEDLNKLGINYKITIEDVESVIQLEETHRRVKRSSLEIGDVTFTSFMSYNEQMAYARRLAEDYPDIVSLETVGQSHEGRDIPLLKISSGPSSSTSIPKPVIFVDAGVHCREWIAPPVALYILNQLIENSTNVALYENIDWMVIPNLNPDGYEYTQTDNRLWRKNRRLHTGNSCYGIDLNRNFGYFFMYAGASNNSCATTYAGPEAFSEPESQALKYAIETYKENIKLYLTFHSYGKWLLYPWGYDVIYPDNAEELQSVAEQAAEAIQNYSTIDSSYTVGNSAALLYAAAGASDDWVKSEGVELSYTVELPDGDSPYSFMIPARQILTVVEETWEGVKVFRDYIEEKHWTNALEEYERKQFISSLLRNN